MHPRTCVCVQASFEELLARELAREQEGQQVQVQQPSSKSASKATFLKRGLLSMGPPLHRAGAHAAELAWQPAPLQALVP